MRKLFLLILGMMLNMVSGQESKNFDEIEKKLGIGINVGYGSFYTSNTNFVSLKIPYKFNEKIEGGFYFSGFLSNKDIKTIPRVENNFGGFGGIYVEPTLFNFEKIKISTPLKLGFGSVGYSLYNTNDFIEDKDVSVEDWDPFFITSFGLNFLIKVSKNSFFEIETNYRSSGTINLVPDYGQNISALTFGVGVKTYLFRI